MFNLETKICGTHFVNKDGKTLFNKLQEGDKLFLLRDPANIYDASAVKVMGAVTLYGAMTHIQVGFIPSEDNGTLAGLLDRGHEFTVEYKGKKAIQITERVEDAEGN